MEKLGSLDFRNQVKNRNKILTCETYSNHNTHLMCSQLHAVRNLATLPYLES